MFIHEKGKLGYLTGATKTPKEDNLGFQTWDSENSMILLWFVNSAEQEISQTRMFLTTTKELWELVMVTYSDLENSAQIFELKSKIHDIKQGDQVVIKYYNILKGFWQELDLFYAFEWACAAHNVCFKKMMEKE